MSLQKDFATKFGPWAVVTGASSGIGLAFSMLLAEASLNVVLVARREDRLAAVAKDITEKYPSVSSKIIVADLSTDAGVKRVADETVDLDVGLLVNNAGMEVHGNMLRYPLDKHQLQISLNVSAVTSLAYHFGRRFSDKGRGGILFVSSLATEPMPWFATYSASKGYVSNLSYALRYELGIKGVNVTSLEPGAVESEMTGGLAGEVDFAKAGMAMMSAEKCATVGLRCLYQNRIRVSPGKRNTMMAKMVRTMPTRASIGMMGMMMKKAMKPELFTYS